MQTILYLEDVEQASVLCKPKRVEILRLLAEARSCTQLAGILGETPQLVYYHIKQLERAGLVEKAAERRVRGIVEGIYKARARSYWFSPGLVRRLGGSERSRDQMSLSFLAELAEQVQEDVGRLAEHEVDTPSLGLVAEILLRDASERAAFLRDVQQTFERLARRHGATSQGSGRTGEAFRLALACYPAREEATGGRRSG